MTEDKVKPFVQSPFDTPIMSISTGKISKIGKRNSLLKYEAPNIKPNRLPIVDKNFETVEEAKFDEIVDEMRLKVNTP